MVVIVCSRFLAQGEVITNVQPYRWHLHSVKIFLRFMFWKKLEISKAYHCLELHFQFRFALCLMRMVTCAVSRLPRSLTLCSCLKFFRVMLFMFKRIPTNCKSFVSFVSSSAITSLVISRYMQCWFFKIFVWAYLFGHITLKQRRWREASLLDKFYLFIAFSCNAKSFAIASVFIFLLFFFSTAVSDGLAKVFLAMSFLIVTLGWPVPG